VKKIFIGVALLCAAGCMKRMTRFRSEFKNCVAGDGGAIVCGGRPAAQVECFQPRSNSCRAMAVRYADGERVWIFQPMGFDPDDPEASAQEDSPVILQPEMSRDASLIWYRRSNGYKGVWETYDPLTGVFDEVDTMGLMRLRRGQYEDGPVSLVPLK
jgi:hypothetical protein